MATPEGDSTAMPEFIVKGSGGPLNDSEGLEETEAVAEIKLASEHSQDPTTSAQSAASEAQNQNQMQNTPPVENDLVQNQSLASSLDSQAQNSNSPSSVAQQPLSTQQDSSTEESNKFPAARSVTPLEVKGGEEEEEEVGNNEKPEQSSFIQNHGATQACVVSPEEERKNNNHNTNDHHHDHSDSSSVATTSSPSSYIWPGAEIEVVPKTKKLKTKRYTGATEGKGKGGEGTNNYDYLVKLNDVDDNENDDSTGGNIKGLKRNEHPVFSEDDDDHSDDSSIDLHRAMTDKSENGIHNPNTDEEAATATDTTTTATTTKTLNTSQKNHQVRRSAPNPHGVRSPSTDTILEEDPVALSSSAPGMSFRGDLSYRQDGVVLRTSNTSNTSKMAAEAVAENDHQRPTDDLSREPSNSHSIASVPVTQAETLRCSRNNSQDGSDRNQTRRGLLRQSSDVSVRQLWRGLKNTVGAMTGIRKLSKSKSPQPRSNNEGNNKHNNIRALSATLHEDSASRGRPQLRKGPSRCRSRSEDFLRRLPDSSQNVTAEELQELEKVALALKEGLSYTSRKDFFKNKTYYYCFSGSAAVDLLCKLLGTGRREALRVGREIVVHFQMFISCQSTQQNSYNGDLKEYLRQRQKSLLQDTSNSYYRLFAHLPTEVRTMSLEKKMAIFEEGVSVRDRRQGLRKYKNCFVGRDAVTFLLASRLVETRREAVDLGRTFVRDYNMFEPVHRDHTFEDAPNRLYRFVDKRKRYFSINDALSTRLIQMHGESADISGSYTKAKPENAYSSGEESGEESEEESIVAVRDDAVTYTKDYLRLREVADVFERGMKLTDNSKVVGVKKKVSYKDSFLAARAVTFLVTSGLATSRDEAANLGRRLEREFNLIQEVTGKHDFGDTNHYFRFTNKKERFTKPLAVEKPLEEIAEDFENGVKVKDYTYRLIMHRNTFVGTKAVDFLVNSRLAASRAEAVRIGRQLIEKFNLFERVTGNREFCDDREFFRFTPLEKRREPEAEDTVLDAKSGHSKSLLTRSTSSRHALVPKHIPEELLQLADSFLTGVKVKENKFRAKTYRRTFVGSEAVSFMVNSSLAKSRKEAVDLGKRLSKEVKLFVQVDGSRDFKDDYLLYQFEERFEQTFDQEQITPSRGLIKGLSGLNNVSVKSLPLEKIAEAFRSNIKVSVHKSRVNKYKDTFVGSEAVDFLVGSGLAESRVDAVDLGRSLAREFNLFRHIHKEHEFKDEDFLYQFCYEGEVRPMEEIQIEIPRLMEIAKDFEQHVKVKEHRVRLRVYEDTFLGSEAVDYMMDYNVASTRREAVQIGRAITKEFNLFEHVSNDRKFEDALVPYYFTKDDDRYKGLKFEKHRGRRNIFTHSDGDTSSSEGGSESSEEFGNDQSVKFEFQSDDTEWATKMATFEKRMQMSIRQKEVDADDDSFEAARKVKINNFLRWAAKFHRLDPRYQIQYFFDYVAQEGAQDVEENDFDLDSLRPIFNFLPNRAQVFTVWRPTSLDAIRKMMLGEAVGKGLDIKGKSAKRGKLSGFVPFLQIGENKHKSKIRPPSKDGVVRVFYPGNSRRGRDIAAESLERVGQEMLDTVKSAKKVLADSDASEEAQKDALDAMLLDMSDPTIRYIDCYAPVRYGFEIPERLFWEAFFVRQDCTRKPGSEYDTGRPSQPAFQDMNFAAIRAQPKEYAPRACVYQSADPDSPMNPFELLVAYEEHGRVMPVVSDFDCFLVGTKRVKFTSPLAPEQMKVLTWYLNEIENVMEESVYGDSWTVQWLEVLKKAAREGFYPEMPRFGFGDPKSYSIMKNAVSRLSHSGAVRHGAECFNYYFPQDLDDEFLVIANDLPNNQPWTYVDVAGLQDILSNKIDEGFTFPLNPKWVLADSSRWKRLYDKLLRSDKEETQQSMDIWFPPESGIREQIERIHSRRPEGFYEAPLRPSPAAAAIMKAGIPRRPPVPTAEQDKLSTVFALSLLEKFQERQKNGEDDEDEPDTTSAEKQFSNKLFQRLQKRKMQKLTAAISSEVGSADGGDDASADNGGDEEMSSSSSRKSNNSSRLPKKTFSTGLLKKFQKRQKPKSPNSTGVIRSEVGVPELITESDPQRRPPVVRREASC